MAKKWVVPAVCAVVAAGSILFAMSLLRDTPPPDNGLDLDPNATTGIMPGIDPEARRQQLQTQLDKSKIAFSINTSPVFKLKTGEGNLLLENPANNAKLITADIVLKDGGETVYTSKALPPGSYLEKVKLDTTLEKGSYEATVYLKGYDEETHELIGQTGAEILLTVED